MIYSDSVIYMYESESESRSVVSNSLRPHGLYSLWNSPGQKTGVGSCSLLQGIFPTQRLNPSFPHCRRILYQLSHQGSPRILEWLAHLFSSGSSRPRNQFSFLDPFPLWVVLIFLLADQIPLVKSVSWTIFQWRTGRVSAVFFRSRQSWATPENSPGFSAFMTSRLTLIPRPFASIVLCLFIIFESEKWKWSRSVMSDSLWPHGL